MKKIGIIGGGLAGLTNAILLARAGFEVTLFEEKKYPFHRVCGEYVSNEVIPFLKRNNLYPEELHPAPISKFRLTSPSGVTLNMPLDLGGFGLSRYAFDLWLAEKAKESGVRLIHQRVVGCHFHERQFEIVTRNERKSYHDLVIGSFGKRSTLDKALSRDFIQYRSPYIGVKYHLASDEVENDVVELHNFKNGYCGVSRVEDQKFNLCYLSHRSNLKNLKSIPEMEQSILMQNPHLKRLFKNSSFLFEKPEVINEITFEKKEPVYNHIFMSGDSAGMITPLCGNGMAMAIHSANILSGLIIENKEELDLEKIGRLYTKEWNHLFAKRLWAGRKIQHLFVAPIASEIAVGLGKTFRPFASSLMKKTHGVSF